MIKKEIKYVANEKLAKHHENLTKKVQKLEDLKRLNEEKIQVLISIDSEENIEKIVKLSDKNQKIKNTILRYEKSLDAIKNEKLEQKSIFKLFKEWFSRIPNNKQKNLWGMLFTAPWFLGMALFFIPSFITSILWSFQSIDVKNNLALTFIGLENYVKLFSSFVINGNQVFTVELYMFVLDLVIDLPIILIFSILIAVFLSKPFKGHTLIKAIFFIPVIFNFALISDTLTKGFGQHMEEVTGAGQLFVDQISNFFLEIGIGGDLIGVILQAVDRIFLIVNLSGIQILICIAAIQAIPVQLYEAAKVEGASKYVMFWKITIAMIMPFILTSAIYTVIDSFARAPIYAFLTNALSSFDYGLSAAISISYFLINIVIILIVFLLMRKRVFYYDDKK